MNRHRSETPTQCGLYRPEMRDIGTVGRFCPCPAWQSGPESLDWFACHSRAPSMLPDAWTRGKEIADRESHQRAARRVHSIQETSFPYHRCFRYGRRNQGVEQPPRSYVWSQDSFDLRIFLFG